MDKTKYVWLEVEDMPTKQQIKDSIDRLNKDHETLKDFGKTKYYDPKSFIAISKFLEYILDQASSRLK